MAAKSRDDKSRLSHYHLFVQPKNDRSQFFKLQKKASTRAISFRSYVINRYRVTNYWLLDVVFFLRLPIPVIVNRLLLRPGHFAANDFRVVTCELCLSKLDCEVGCLPKHQQNVNKLDGTDFLKHVSSHAILIGYTPCC